MSGDGGSGGARAKRSACACQAVTRLPNLGQHILHHFELGLGLPVPKGLAEGLAGSLSRLGDAVRALHKMR
jgi:hypothetical protein